MTRIARSSSITGSWALAIVQARDSSTPQQHCDLGALLVTKNTVVEAELPDPGSLHNGFAVVQVRPSALAKHGLQFRHGTCFRSNVPTPPSCSARFFSQMFTSCHVLHACPTFSARSLPIPLRLSPGCPSLPSSRLTPLCLHSYRRRNSMPKTPHF